jgi:hypothetical protein
LRKSYRVDKKGVEVKNILHSFNDACQNIITEKKTNLSSIVYHVKGIETQYNFDLDKLMESFPTHALFIHPIKFTKWKSKKNIEHFMRKIQPIRYFTIA